MISARSSKRVILGHYVPKIGAGELETPGRS
jgi:hypothetical protein